MHPKWQLLLASERERLERIAQALSTQDFQPGPQFVMRVLEIDPTEIKVVIIGQDPYPNPAHAVGLAFAVPPGTRPLPPTLRNILSELAADLDLAREEVEQVDLADWQQQGVMLLNRHLTTNPGLSLTHTSLGWEEFTDQVVRLLVEMSTPPIFVLWGAHAQRTATLLKPGVVSLSSPHPSPLSAYRGFFGSRPFSRINEELIRRGQTPINWLHA